MESHWPEVLGAIVSVIGVSFLFLKWISHQISTSIEHALSPLDEKINDVKESAHEDLIVLESRINVDIGKKEKEINAVSERLTTRIDIMSESVVYKDFFEQHAKLEDERHQATKDMISLLKDHMKQSAHINTTEHSRICGKMDAMPSLINEAMISVMNSMKNNN